MEVKQISTRIPADLHQKVRIKAIKVNKSVSQVIKEMLEKWVEDDDD